jgi:hypothetical protein
MIFVSSELTGEVPLAPSAVIYDGSVVADGDLSVVIRGFYYDMAGVNGYYPGASYLPITDAAINYVYLDNTGAVVINTTGWPLSATHIRLARVFAQGGTIVRISLERAFFTAGAGASAGVIQKFFSWVDFPGPVTIGTIPVGSTIEKTILEVQSPFDNGIQVSVGETIAMARLMAVSDNRLDIVESFRVENDYLCPSVMTVRVYFVGIAPTVGLGRVIVYYS